MQNFQTEFHSVVTSALEKEEQEKTLDVVENGTYKMSADEDKVLSSATVNVNVPLKYEEGYADGYNASQNDITLQEKTATENGEVVTDAGFTGMSKVIVAVPIKEEQEKTLSVTANGSYSVEPDEGKVISKVDVDVNVSFEGDVGKPYIDTSKMTDFTYFFYKNARLELLPNLDIRNGTNFSNMFYYCSTVEIVQLAPTSKGTGFASMFHACKALKEVYGLDLSSVTTSNSCMYLFKDCNALETVSMTNNGYTDLPSTVFEDCKKLTNVIINNGWRTSLYLHYSENLTTESLHGMIENLADLTGKTAKTFKIGATNLAKIDEEHLTMLQNKNWNYS